MGGGEEVSPTFDAFGNEIRKKRKKNEIRRQVASGEERRKREENFLLEANRWEEKENKKREKERKKMDREGGKEKVGRKGKFSQCSDGRSSTVRELKLVDAMRATHGYQNLEFRQTPRGREFSYSSYF